MRLPPRFFFSMRSVEGDNTTRAAGRGLTLRRAACAALVFFAAASGGCGGGSGSGKPVRVTVPQGASLGVAADSLARAGVIRSARPFRLYSFVRRDDRAIKAGTYLLRRGSGVGVVLDALRGGKGP